MSTFIRLTLIGLVNHYPELFNELRLPAAYDVDTFKESLLLDHGEKRVAYPEPEFMRYAIGVWSRKWAASLERIALALNAEYNPIHNYDRYEEINEHETGDYRNNVKRGGSDTTTNNGTTNETTTSETEQKVSAYNESTYQPKEQTTNDAANNTTAQNTETQTYGGTENGEGDDKRDRTHDAHMYGNIGVTTNMQMVEAELSLRRNQNMYAIAAELFADDLLLMLY